MAISVFNNSSSKNQTACCPNLCHKYRMFYSGYLISGHSNLYLYIVNLYTITGKIIRKLSVVSPQELSSQLLTLLASRVSYTVYWILGRRPNIQTRQSRLHCSNSLIAVNHSYHLASFIKFSTTQMFSFVLHYSTINYGCDGMSPI